MKQSKTAIVVSQIIEKLQLIGGIFLTIVFGLSAIICMADGYTEISVVIVMYIIAIIGVVLIVFSRKRHNLIKSFRIYVSYLSVNPTGLIENLAEDLGISQNIIKNNLTIMIDRKYFANAYIDKTENRIVFPASSMADTSSDNNYSTKQDDSNSEFVDVNCKSCGGINRILKGRTSRCDYCGSYIK